MIFDQRIDEERVRQFASQTEHMQDSLLRDLSQLFEGEKSAEFYEGLLSAYANMHNMLQTLTVSQIVQYSGPLVSYTARQLQKVRGK